MIDPRRVNHLNQRAAKTGPVVYWMQRDQRVHDNWALLFAQNLAQQMQQPLIVVFCLVPEFLDASNGHYHFMLSGLKETEQNLDLLGMPFILLKGNPLEVLPEFIEKTGAGRIITDFNPLRNTMKWKHDLASHIDIPMLEVDAHNIIPARYISRKPEYGAQFMRRKIELHLREFLVEIPKLKKHTIPLTNPYPPNSWMEIFTDQKTTGQNIIFEGFVSGEQAALLALEYFIQNRLDNYDHDRNDPVLNAQSDLSPYLHFGQISAQRIALEVRKSQADAGSKKAFLEELIVRRELADNFCLYNPKYDSFEGFSSWAKATLNKHREDPREYLYSPQQFELAETQDELWNAAQKEMIKTGKMHGFMRMYWAKKILEWTASPEEAMTLAIYLNNKYSLDGRDPNGYAGIAWAIGGTHDRPWGERKIFGMIRYMNYQGCKRKFNIQKYISKTLNRKS
jgi:deoxyribodipyrimidine photo-lyase